MEDIAKLTKTQNSTPVVLKTEYASFCHMIRDSLTLNSSEELESSKLKLQIKVEIGISRQNLHYHTSKRHDT